MTAEEFEEVQEGAPEAEDDIASLKQALEEEKGKAEGYLANWQRAQADFVNYKRRNEQDKEELSKFATASLILSLLPILDDFERASASAPHKAAKTEWSNGIILIEQKLRDTLKAQGLEPIEALGKPFDPAFHEAVRQEPGEDGAVLAEIQKGYLLNDKLLRPAKVIVGNGEAAEQKEE